MTKQDLIKKITSRKFVSLLVALINNIVVMATVGYSPETLTEMVTVTTACIGYMFAETIVDAKAATTTTISANTTAKETVESALKINTQ